MAEDNRLRFPLAGSSTGASYGRSTPAPTEHSDPLAELARLIGQDDVFGPNRREPAAMLRRSATAAVAREQAYEPSYGASEENRDTDYAARIYGYEAQRAATQDGRGNEAAPAASHPAEPYGDEPPEYRAATPAATAEETAYEDEDYEYEQAATPPLQRRRPGLAVVGAVLALAVVGTAGAVGYRAMKVGVTGGKAPVIVADKTPTKILAPTVAADAPAGAIRSLPSDTPKDSKMLVREEQPVEMREAKASTARMLPYAGGPNAASIPGQLAAPMATGSVPNPNEPRKVHTLTIRPDGSIAQQSAVANNSSTRSVDLQAPGARGRASQPRPPAPIAAAPRPPANVDTRTASIQPTDTPAGARPKVAAGSHVVQLTSQRTEPEAQASFRGLQAKYPSILAGREALIRKVDLGQRGTYYRAQVGPFSSIEQANELCGQLKAAGGQCIVQKN